MSMLFSPLTLQGRSIILKLLAETNVPSPDFGGLMTLIGYNVVNEIEVVYHILTEPRELEFALNTYPDVKKWYEENHNTEAFKAFEEGVQLLALNTRLGVYD